ncbi:MAG: GNAT family N-acetyltransferase [Candidatus Humimicrobiaceae bacterium]
MDRQKIKITDKISISQLDHAIEIYYCAFKRKIKALIKSKEKALAIYKKSLNADRVLYAVLDEKVVGIAGLHYDNKNFVEIKYKDLREYFNPIFSYFVYFIYRKMSPELKNDVIRIDSIAVDEDARGQGIGSILIEKVVEFAKDKGFKEVILEVVDTNPKAKKLYEKIGFNEKKLVKFYFTSRVAGFSSEFIMSYNMENFVNYEKF